LPASLTLGIAPASGDNNSKVPTTAWVRTYVSGLSYQGAITLTVTGTSGAATLVGNTLNIPTYTLAGLGGQAALSGTGFVKISGTTISYDNNTYATQTYVGTAIANLVDSSPATLDTLNELAAALGDDPNFATTVATSIGTKQAQLNGTGFVKVTGTTVSYDNSTYLTTGTAGTTYVPYTGGTANVNLGVYDLDGGNININGAGSGGGALRLKQFGSSEANREGYNSISTLTSGVFYFTSSASVPNFKNFALNPSGLTDNTLRTYALPDASGTIALTSNLSAYLPLTGGTLTGPLIGTSATFNHNDAPTVRVQRNGGTDSNTVLEFTNASRSFFIGSNGTVMGLGGTSGSITGQPLQITSTGAATFSSSVTATGLNLANTTNGFVGLRLEGTGTYAGSDWTIYASALSPSSADDFLGFYNNSTTDGATSEYKFRLFKTGAAVFSSSITTSGNINVNSDGIFINRSTSGEPYIFFRKDGVNRASIYGVTGGGLRIFDESDNQVLTITGTKLGISDPSPSRKLTVNFGTLVNDGLIVYGSQRQNTVFRSTGEHCFVFIDSHHADTFLPVLNFQRSSVSYGSIGLNRASNSDAIGAYAESEMVVGSVASVPFSLQTNGVRRIRMASGGGVEVFNTLSVSDNLTARNFSRIIKYFNPAGSTGSGTAVTYNWADELAALAGNFDTGGFYKGFIRSGNGAHYHGYHFDILVGSIGYGGNSLQFKVQNITAANSAWAGGCGGSPFGSVDNTSFVHVNNPCGEVLQLSITKLGV
jgi:hypothetical protein